MFSNYSSVNFQMEIWRGQLDLGCEKEYLESMMFLMDF